MRSMVGDDASAGADGIVDAKQKQDGGGGGGHLNAAGIRRSHSICKQAHRRRCQKVSPQLRHLLKVALGRRPAGVPFLTAHCVEGGRQRRVCPLPEAAPLSAPLQTQSPLPAGFQPSSSRQRWW